LLSVASPDPVEMLAHAESRTLCLPARIAEQAAANPAAPAVTDGAVTLTYGELEGRSNQLARFLQSAGVGAEHVVGLYLERTPEMVVAALAILKAGAAYLPLPPDSPRERLAFTLLDAQVTSLVTTSGLAGELAAGDYHTVVVDRDAKEIAKHSAGPVACHLHEDALAYVIYTSGSSGQPKGVEILHRGLLNLIGWHLRAFQVTSADRASHLAALGFDAAVWELWPYLAAGASVHLAKESIRQNPEALRDWLVAQQITVAFVATPLAERLMLLDWPKGTVLRILLTGADTLHHCPPASLPFMLVNNYGPTEYTVVATSGQVLPSGSASRRPSIGRPIDNTQIYVLDGDMKEVAAGTRGELYIGGAGMARGYRNHAQWTEQRFVANPFHSTSADSAKGRANGNGCAKNHLDDRLYRTGDEVRCLPNGEIEFLGRFDEQVKIRGYRIEPGEIVNVLDAHPEVVTSAVVARELEEGGEKSLIAYVVLAANAKLTAATLREYLSKRLPPYMVPGRFVRVAAMPVTSNGKVDRAALPVPNTANCLPDEAFVSPRTLVEQRLAAILSTLLHVKQVGVNDNFFLLGGHSLLGTQLLTRISQSFGVDLTLLALFNHPTLAEMSEEIEKLILAKLEAAGTDADEDVGGGQAKVSPSHPGGGR